MEQELLDRCVLNNANWCNLISLQHNAQGTMNTDVWMNLHAVPTYYPNLVTLKPLTNIDRYISDISIHLTSNWAIKDSYNTLQLDSNKFNKLFDANWVYKEPSQFSGNSDWEIIESESQLIEWENAWKKTSPITMILFNKELLRMKDVVFICKRTNNIITAGAIAYNNSNVIGVSNFFSNNFEKDFIESTEKIQLLFPDSTLVYYDSALQLDAAYKADYKNLGALSVWLYKNTV